MPSVDISSFEIGRAVQQECRDRYRMPSSACKKQADFRAAFDGDADRCFFVDDSGEGGPSGASSSTSGAVLSLATSPRRSSPSRCWFFFNDTATTEISTLSLHDALPIYYVSQPETAERIAAEIAAGGVRAMALHSRSEERVSRNAETDVVCRLLLGK